MSTTTSTTHLSADPMVPKRYRRGARMQMPARDVIRPLSIVNLPIDLRRPAEARETENHQ